MADGKSDVREMSQETPDQMEFARARNDRLQLLLANVANVENQHAESYAAIREQWKKECDERFDKTARRQGKLPFSTHGQPVVEQAIFDVAGISTDALAAAHKSTSEAPLSADRSLPPLSIVTSLSTPSIMVRPAPKATGPAPKAILVSPKKLGGKTAPAPTPPGFQLQRMRQAVTKLQAKSRRMIAVRRMEALRQHKREYDDIQGELDRHTEEVAEFAEELDSIKKLEMAATRKYRRKQRQRGIWRLAEHEKEVQEGLERELKDAVVATNAAIANGRTSPANDDLVLEDLEASPASTADMTFVPAQRKVSAGVMRMLASAQGDADFDATTEDEWDTLETALYGKAMAFKEERIALEESIKVRTQLDAIVLYRTELVLADVQRKA